MSLLEHLFWKLGMAAFTILAAHLLYRVYWAPRRDRRRSFAVWTSVVVLCLLSTVTALEPYDTYLIHAAVFLLSFCYDMRGAWHLLGLPLVISLISVGEILAMGVLTLINAAFTGFRPALVGSGASLYLLRVAGRLLALLPILLIRSTRKGRLLPGDPNLSWLSLVCPAFTVLHIMACNALREYLNTLFLSVMDIALPPLLLFANIALISIAEQYTQVQIEQREKLLANQSLVHQSVRYQQQLRQYSETARAMHDTRNQLIVGAGLLREGRAEEAYHLLQKVVPAESVSLPAANETVLDTMLEYWRRHLREQGIVFLPNILVPESCAISLEELAATLGGLLENAVHACGEAFAERQRYIDLTVRQLQDYLCVQVEHPALACVPENVQTMEDFGLRSVRLLAEKHEGNVQIQQEGDLRMITALLKNAVTV